ncbi:MAG: PD-(D/E)XK nuclease family protein, partial [Ruminiclostridium sp.]|nr:PD-(D/E)XK nuclease family protein [Ruminiclostridium sp.]
TNKEKFYINKLYKELEYIVNTINNQDKHSSFNETLTEHNVLIKKEDDFNIKGFIDKIRILKENNTTYVSIIDYKTGNTDLSSTTDENGRWEMCLPPFAASCDSYCFSFTCGGETLTFDDIYFGELFHISGQSNMELPMYRTYDPFRPEKFPTCGYIRAFRVPVKNCFGKDEEYEDFLGGEWCTADEKNVPEMSAAGFYCALDIYEKYGVPVGLLDTSAGGAPVEARMPYRMLKELGWYDDFLSMCTKEGYIENTEKSDAERNIQRNAEIDSLDSVSDRIMNGGDVSFEKCTIPFDFKDMPELAGFCGRVWFRKTFDIPADADLSGATLILGTITDADTAYLNGVYAGETGYMYPPRIYPLPDGAANHGRNTLFLRVDSRYACGGFTKGKRYCIKLKDRIIDLDGEWEFCIAARVDNFRRETFFQGLPLSMYAALTAPAFNVRCRAMLWYQGESNCNHTDRYEFLFGEFVKMYRKRCGYDIPVITTQLCNFDDPFAGGSDSWAELRFAQLKCLSIPATDMAVTVDVGESNDLHPLNKRDVGKRLARCVMRTVYGEKSVLPDVLCTGAEYLGSDNGAGKVLLAFSDNARVRISDGGADSFDICFEQGMMSASSAEMTENGLLLGFSSGEKPVKVRCEWRNDPKVVLWDSDGLPLSPFETKVG